MKDFEIKLAKYKRIADILGKNNITLVGLVDDLIQTYHNDNSIYTLNQNPIWWEVATEEEIINSIIKTFKK
jgi:hypothetical protein